MIDYVENSKEPTKKSKLKTKFRSFREKINRYNEKHVHTYA